MKRKEPLTEVESTKLIIGTIRPEEAKVFDQFSGYHDFHDEDRKPFGSFEIFWQNEQKATWNGHDEPTEDREAGWYWWASYPGCLPDSEPSGPFASSRQALEDADEWNPEFS